MSSKLMSRLKTLFLLGYSDNPEIAVINIQRILITAYILTPLHILHAVLFWIAWTGKDHTPGDVAYYWRMGIICAHGFMAVLVGTACVLAYKIKNKKLEDSLPGRAIPNATAFGYLLFGVVICIIDQLVTTSINPYLIANVAVAIVVIMRPQISTALYVATYLLFYFLLPDTTTDRACMAAEKIRKAIEKHFFFGPIQDLRITASFGIALIDAHKTNAFDFAYQKADQAMYQAKAKGRNRVECVD